MSGFALATSAALRVASLDLCADEYLLSLARPGEIASLSYLSSDPAESAWARQARRLPRNHGHIEEVLGARPQLLLASGIARDRDRVAQRLGLPLLRLPAAASPAEVAANLSRVAQALGDAGRARPFARRLAALEHEARTRAPRSAWWIGHGGLTQAPGSLGARWMRLAGFEQQAVAGGRVTLEALATRPPATLLLSDYRAHQHSAGQALLSHPLVARARARRLTTDGRAWTCMGPPLLGEAERLARHARSEGRR